ncbi:accessory factor UbiK family protein [Parvibaculum sp. MBR-TMA-1.3b-4.2]|jgi:BMFP domain-containing protein YqiC
MTQTQNKILEEMSRFFTNAAGAAQGVRTEVETVIRSQAERLIADMDLVQREEFEAVQDMARLAREENEALKKRIEALEKAAKPAAKKPAAKKAAPKKKPAAKTAE